MAGRTEIAAVEYNIQYSTLEVQFNAWFSATTLIMVKTNRSGSNYGNYQDSGSYQIATILLLYCYQIATRLLPQNET